MIPISFWFLVVLGALWIFAQSMHAKNLTKFESLMNHYYSPQFKAGSPAQAGSGAQGPASHSAGSLAAEIQKLEDMRAKGVINDQEFSQLKKKLIGAA